MADADRPAVLVVDDEPVTLKLMARLLESADADIVTAHSGEEALELLEDREFAVVLLDVLMPGLDGFETAETIRAREEDRRTPIIFVTGLGDAEEFVTRGYAVGAVDYLTKPVSSVVIRSKVAAFVSMQARRTARRSPGKPVSFDAHVKRSLADKYDDIQRLAAGGMATVYRAGDPNRDVPIAIKVLRGQMVSGPDGWQAMLPDGSTQLQRFNREIEVLHGLDHPHILPVYDAGDIDGIPYYTMPYVVEGSLSDLLDEDGLLTFDHAITVTASIADALTYAHAHGVLHRDIKPGNILLSGLYAVLTDFGIARFAVGNERLTRTGIAVGTPSYMSPEQARGLAIDGRSDLYSLGAVLYEMVTGQPPFDGSTPEATAAAVLTEKLVKPERYRKDLPAELSKIILKAMARDPEKRYRNPQQFKVALVG